MLFVEQHFLCLFIVLYFMMMRNKHNIYYRICCMKVGLNIIVSRKRYVYLTIKRKKKEKESED